MSQDSALLLRTCAPTGGDAVVASAPPPAATHPAARPSIWVKVMEGRTPSVEKDRRAG
jgi:hypothetical protein